MTPADAVLWDLWIAQYAATRESFVVDSRHTITDQPLTVEVCARAAEQGHAISGYLAAKWEDGDWRTTMGAIDVDTTIEDAHQIRTTLTRLGVRTLMALSRRGAHLWCWTAGDGTHDSQPYMPVLAAKMRKALQMGVDMSIKDEEARKHIEVFPKVAGRSVHSVGALRMPLFRHPKSGIVYPVVDEGGHEILDRVEAYRATIALDTPYKALYALAPVRGSQDTSWRSDRSYEGRGDRQFVAPSRAPEGPGVRSILAQLGVPRAESARYFKCPFHEDQHASMSVAPDDQRVFCHAPACPIHNGGRGTGSLALAKLVRGR